MERTFDESGNTIREQYFNAEGAKIASNGGYDEVRRTYNEKNQMIRESYYLSNNPVLNTNGFAAKECIYD